MTTALTKAQPQGGALVQSDDELLAVLGSSLYPGAEPASIRMVLGYCRAAGLDPMQKPVHIVPVWDSKAKRMRDVIMPGINSYRVAAARSEQFVGMSEPEFGPATERTFVPAEGKGPAFTIEIPQWCRVTVKRLVRDQVAEFTAVERWSENYATAGRDTDSPNAMWRKRPWGQLAKCAQAQALRIAFPELAAPLTAEEMEGKSIQDGSEIIDAASREIVEAPPELLAAARAAAAKGWKALGDWLVSTSEEQRNLLRHELEGLKTKAADVTRAERATAAETAEEPAAPVAADDNAEFIAALDKADQS